MCWKCMRAKAWKCKHFEAWNLTTTDLVTECHLKPTYDKKLCGKHQSGYEKCILWSSLDCDLFEEHSISMIIRGLFK